LTDPHYVPERGDIVHVNFDETAGQEMDGPHFGLVMSPSVYAKRTGMTVVLAATSHYKHNHPRFGFTLPLPDGLIKTKKNPKGKGWILCDAVRNIDWKERKVEFAARVDTEFVEEALDIVLTVMQEARPSSK